MTIFSTSPAIFLTSLAACELERSASAGREDLRSETQCALEVLGYTR